MRYLTKKTLTLAAGLAAVVGLVGFVPSTVAFATVSTGSIPPGTTFDVGLSPIGIPGSCPFVNGDASLVFSGNNYVSYGTSNKNGDWGGLSAEGTAVFEIAPVLLDSNGNPVLDSNGNPTDVGPAVLLYQGHVHTWFEGGNNAKGQNENGTP